MKDELSCRRAGFNPSKDWVKAQELAQRFPMLPPEWILRPTDSDPGSPGRLPKGGRERSGFGVNGHSCTPLTNHRIFNTSGFSVVSNEFCANWENATSQKSQMGHTGTNQRWHTHRRGRCGCLLSLRWLLMATVLMLGTRVSVVHAQPTLTWGATGGGGTGTCGYVHL
jgi:hypothetical protein